MHRYCKINRIGDEHILKVKDFVIFDDAYIMEYDRYLIDENTNEVYEALVYTTIEENVLENPEVMPWANGWRMRKRTTVTTRGKRDANDYTETIIYCGRVLRNRSVDWLDLLTDDSLGLCR